MPALLYMCVRFTRLALAASVLFASLTAEAQPTLTASPDYRQRFDSSDKAFNDGRGYSESSNKGGLLAWSESYVLTSYIEMYRATGDPAYLRRLVDHFDRMLKNRDDALGLKDAYTGRSFAGWGSSDYSDGKWHVWLVHTGMIELAPAEFVHLVLRSKTLRKEFGAKAEEYRVRIDESIKDAEVNWRTGPREDEGYYYEPNLGSIQPTNQQDIFGAVLIEMYGATGNRAYRDKAEKLARFFRNRLRTTDPEVYDWAYWPREKADGPGSEDISHAGINISFVAHCVEAGIVFSRKDADRFARTWLQKVRQPDGRWSDTVAGKGSSGAYTPYAVGLWMSLCGAATKSVAAELYRDGERALGSNDYYHPAELPGAARLLRYSKLHTTTPTQDTDLGVK